AFERQQTTRLLGKPVSLAEAKSAASSDIFRREERLKSPRFCFFVHAGAVVLDRNQDTIARTAFVVGGNILRSDTQDSPLRHGIARVEADIEQRQLELARIDIDGPKVGRNFGDDLDIAAQRTRQQIPNNRK